MEVEVNKIRKENLKILENWYEDIKNFEKLNITSAKELNKLMLNEKDEKKKLQLREKLIYGTLHIVYKFLKDSEFLDFKSPSYTMDDIISETVNFLINSIDQGKILEIPFLSSLFNTPYYWSLVNKLIGEKRSILLTSANYTTYKKIMNWYFDLRNKGNDIDFNTFEDSVKSLFNLNSLNAKIFDYIDLYNGLNGFYEYCQKNNINTLDETSISRQYREFINNVGNDIIKKKSNNKQVMPDDLFEKVSFEEMTQTLLDMLNLELISDRAKTIIYMRYGLDGKEYTLREIGEHLHISPERVRDIEYDTLRFLRHTYRYKIHLNKEHDKVLKKWRSYHKSY